MSYKLLNYTLPVYIYFFIFVMILQSFCMFIYKELKYIYLFTINYITVFIIFQIAFLNNRLRNV